MPRGVVVTAGSSRSYLGTCIADAICELALSTTSTRAQGVGQSLASESFVTACFQLLALSTRVRLHQLPL